MRLLSYCRGFANVNHHRTDPCSGTAYTLAFAGLLLLGGRLADRFGARRTLALGVVGFAAASAVGGAAPDGAMLIAARAVQGAFAAVLVSSTKSLLVTVYTDERERARAMSVFGATFCSLAMVGLVYGLGEVTATGGARPRSSARWSSRASRASRLSRARPAFRTDCERSNS